MLNQKLEVGDEVILLYMGEEDGFSVTPGTKGVVKGIFTDEHYTQYYVDWENGSKLSLIAGIDAWRKVNKEKTLKEGEFEKMQIIMDNSDLFKLFNMGFLRKYLIHVRDSGITNMLISAKYLYMGKDRIKHEFFYNQPPNEEAFEEVLDNANTAQAEMIRGVMKFLEKNNKETSLENINRYLHKFATKIVVTYTALF